MDEPAEAAPSVFARAEPVFEFDPAAAADEVQRVRHSLARKREARSQFQLEGEVSPDAFLSEHAQAPAPSSDGPEAYTREPMDNDPHFSHPDHAPMPYDAPDQQQVDSAQSTPQVGITLALALESEALEMWQEARELAQEALDTGDTEQMIQAQLLINRLDAREQH